MLGMDYNYVRRVIEEIRKSRVAFIFPNYRSLGISIGIVLGERLSLPEQLLSSKATMFFKGRTIAPRIYEVYMYAFDHVFEKDFLEAISSDASAVFVDSPLEEEILEYFRDCDRVRILSFYSVNPLVSLRKIAASTKQPFSTVRYVISRAFEEGVLHPSLKILRVPQYYRLNQLIVVSPGMKNGLERPDTDSYLDVEVTEFVHDAKGENISERVYCIRSEIGYNLMRYVSSRFNAPIPIVEYSFEPFNLYEGLLRSLSASHPL